ncbi:hypothetical protein GDO81_029393, partial [Engystomops pustulosus]
SLWAPLLRTGDPWPMNGSHDTSALLMNGSYVTLDCDAGGQDVTSYTFYRDEKTICSEPHVTCRGRYLDFTPITEKDSGSYTCSIQNQVSSSTSLSLRVTITWSPEGNILCTAEQIDHIVRLGCSWPGGQPAANVTMLYRNLTETGRDQVYSNVSQVLQDSSLMCGGEQLGRTSTCVMLFEPPQSPEHDDASEIVAMEGEAFTLKLILRSDSQSRLSSSSLHILPADFSWSLGGDFEPIENGDRLLVTSSHDSSSLQIPEVSVMDSGHYVCRAINLVGSRDFNFTVKVKSRVSHPLLSGDVIGRTVIGILVGLVIIFIVVCLILKRKQGKNTSIIH